MTNAQSYPVWNVNMWKSATLVSPRVFYNVHCLRDKSWQFGKHHLKKYNGCGRSFQVRKLSNHNIWSVVIVTKTCFMSQLRIFGPQTNTMSCWQKMPLQYNTSNHFYQKSVVSESIFAIKKKKKEIVVIRHIHTRFGRSSQC